MTTRGEEALAAAVLISIAAGCGGTGVTPVNEPTTMSARGEAEDPSYFKAKCKSEIEDCLADAKEHCGGTYTVLHKESHAGGLLADALPGPVTWFTVTFRCGESGEDTLRSARRNALALVVMPVCESDW